MQSRKGLPKQTDAKKDAGLDWKVLEGEWAVQYGVVSRFFRMHNGKGLPKQTDVKKMLDWKVWKVNGQLNMELFRAFSGMHNGKRPAQKGGCGKGGWAGSSGQWTSNSIWRCPAPLPPCSMAKPAQKGGCGKGAGLGGLEREWAVQYGAAPRIFPPCTMAKACPNRRMWKRYWTGRSGK